MKKTDLDIRVYEVKFMRDICFSTYEMEGSQDGSPNIAAIISIEHCAHSPDQPTEPWRLSAASTSGIRRHYTKLFYDDQATPDVAMDLFKSKRDADWIRQRVADLNETLAFVNDIAQSGVKGVLAIHCIRGLHRSPVLAVGILSCHNPEASAATIIEMLLAACHQTPQLRHGELAFVDAFFGWNGGLLEAWVSQATALNNPGNKFNLDDALELQAHFCRIMGMPERPSVSLQSPANGYKNEQRGRITPAPLL